MGMKGALADAGSQELFILGRRVKLRQLTRCRIGFRLG
jgi:hypothetical protein